MEPFDPVALARSTEEIVCRGSARKYTEFYCVGVYGGISTGYSVGCNLRCAFCWISWSRDFPEKLGDLFTPEDAFRELKRAADKWGISKMRLSGAEPTIGKSHLLKLLELVENSNRYRFILETNGILFGVDKDFVRRVSRFESVHVRVSLKAGTPEMFQRKTGAKRSAFELPFQAIRNLLDEGASFHVAAMSGDPRIMDHEERIALHRKLWDIDRKLSLQLEEEVIDPYPTTLKRLELAGYDIRFPLKQRYSAVSSLFG